MYNVTKINDKKYLLENENRTFVLYNFVGWKITSKENYNARIQNAREINNFNEHDGFNTADDCIEYVQKHF